jgi:hypothetical protein
LALAICLAGSAAAINVQAQVAPMPRCDTTALSAEEATFEGYDFTLVGDGFAYYERRRIGGGRWEFILEHCPTRQRLTVFLEGNGVEANQQRFNEVLAPVLEAIRSERSYTLRDLRQIALAEGASAAVGEEGNTSCVCAVIGFR